MLAKPLIAVTAGLVVAIPVGPALAKDGRAEVRTAGQCTGTAMWKLKVKEDDAGVEVEFEVDANVVGQTWDYTVSGPSGVLSSGQRTTTAPSGSFSVELTAAGTAADTFTGVATFNGQTCDTRVSAPTPGPTPTPTDDNPSGDDATDDRGSDDSATCDNASAVLRVKGKKATLRVDSSSRGEKWRYEIRRDGRTVKKGVARTKGSKAVFKVRAKSTATGAFTASANRVGSDDSCEISS